MTFLHRLASILDWIFRRSRAERHLDDEMRDFIERSAAEKVRDGVAVEDARRLARLELGGLEQAKERVRSSRHGHMLDEIGRDLRYALRTFARTPSFTFVVLLTLALGVGANTAIFSLIDALMLRSLPVKSPGELVLINLRERDSLGEGGETLSYAMVRALDASPGIFAGVAGFTVLNFDAGSAGAVRRVPGALVTGGFYQTLGLQPSAGRLLTRDDDEPGAELAAVISDGFWTRQYGRAPSAIGQTIPLNGVPARIVGVGPRGFAGANVGAEADITIATAALPQVRPSMAPVLGPGNFWLRALARPAPGLSRMDAATRLNSIWPGLAESVIAPHWPEVRRRAMAASVFVLEPGATGWTYLRGMYERPLLVLLAVAGVVLLIACANVASLFLARAATRGREIALRLAIGASRGRIVRQLVIEGAVLSVTGAALGVGVAMVSSRFLVDLISSGPFQIAFDLTPNWRVLGFSSAIAVATGLFFGLAPAFQTRRAAAVSAMGDDDRTSTRRSKLLPALVTFQVALSLVLVTGAGLFVRTLRNLQQLDPGFTTEGVFVVELERGKGPAPEHLLDVVRRTPGVTMAGVATHTPLNGSSWSEAIVPAGEELPKVDNARIIGVGPAFLPTLKIPIVAGRDVSDRDTTGAPAVAIVNERYAGRYFPGQNPIGQHLISRLQEALIDFEIVGVVANSNAAGLRRMPPPIVYVSYAQFGSEQTPSLALRASGPTGEVAESVRAALQAELPQSVVDVRPLAGQVSSTIVQERMMATLAAGFGALALVLSSVGLYGLLAYTVAQRRKEIGIRLALGATPSSVIRHVLVTGARLVGIGLVLGYPAAWLASRAIASMLYGLRPTDLATTVAAIGVLAGAAFLASYVPATRAAHVDPLIALRHD